jgi:hypothetical protein
LMRSPIRFSVMKASAAAPSASGVLIEYTEAAASGSVRFAEPSLRCIVTGCTVRLFPDRLLDGPGPFHEKMRPLVLLMRFSLAKAAWLKYE